MDFIFNIIDRIEAIKMETWLVWFRVLTVAFCVCFVASIVVGLCLAFLWADGLWIEGVLIGALVHLEIFACLTGIFASLKGEKE